MNIYSLIEHLEQMKKHGSVQGSHYDFIQKLLTDLRDPKLTLNRLAIIKNNVEAELDKIQASKTFQDTLLEALFVAANELNEKIFRSPKFEIYNYTNTIQLSLRTFDTIKNKRDKIRDTKTPKARQLTETMDNIYSLATTDGVTLVKAMAQEFDIRLGNSSGACAGYTLEWIRCHLRDEIAFGVTDLKHHLQPAKLDSAQGRSAPEKMHQAPLTQAIHKLHISQNDTFTRRYPPALTLKQAPQSPEQARKQGLNPKTKNFTAEEEKTRAINRKLVSYRRFYNNPTEIADKLIAKATTDRILQLNLNQRQSGHAIGFKKDRDGTCHFLDANSGWWKFKDAATFKTWMPKYFEATDFYTHNLPEYEIHAYAKATNTLIDLYDEESEPFYSRFIRAVYYPVKSILELPRLIWREISDLIFGESPTTEAQRRFTKTNPANSYGEMAEALNISREQMQVAKLARNDQKVPDNDEIDNLPLYIEGTAKVPPQAPTIHADSKHTDHKNNVPTPRF